MTRFDLVCFSHLRWDSVYQRPHHLLTRCAREQRVFFVEEPVDDDGPAHLEISRRADNLWIVTPHLPGGLCAEEVVAAQHELMRDLFTQHAISDYVLWYYTPMAIAFTAHLDRPLAVVYDCMDELSAFRGAPASLRALEAGLFERADLVFTGGQSLYEAKRDQHPHVYAFPSSVDSAHFAQARLPQQDPTDQAAIGHPRLGFYGVIDERMDLDLLASVADAQPEWQLVLLGPVVKIDAATLPKRPNLHYLGSKSYADLPRYLAGWDVALLPFARNEATRFISPTKTPEYLAAGKPVVSTSIRDVARPYGEDGLAWIADSPCEFVIAVAAAMREDSATRLKRVDAFLAQTSWDRTWARMSQLIEAAIKAHPTHPAPLGPPRLNDVAASAASSGVGMRPTLRAEALFDYLIVGAGFAGSVLAERLASQAGKKVLILDKRSHIGGNAYDHYNDAGLLVHKYGPHIFHTNALPVFDYLGQFTAWRPYQHRVLASVDGRHVPMPINLDTINALYGLSLTSFELDAFFASVAEPCEQVRTSEDVVVSKVGRELYEKFFRGYTRKQWGLDPSELDASVTARVPTRTNRDDRYFTDTYQAMPLHGYTRMFETMLDHPNIKIMLNTDYQEARDFIPYREMIYTGPVDEFFGYRFGKLPYRSLEFRHETHDTPVYQQAPVINYPNDHQYTRVTEFKYLTGQDHPKTSIVYEYPRAEGDPYYPVPRPENAVLYQKYKTLADATPGVRFVGRLATYKYYNMDQVVAQALAVFERIMGARRSAARAQGVQGDTVRPSVATTA